MTTTERTWTVASITTAAALILGVPTIAGFFGNGAALIACIITAPTFAAVFFRTLNGPRKHPEPPTPKNAIQDLIDWKRRRNREALHEWQEEWDRLDPTRKLHAGGFITTNEARGVRRQP